MRQYLLLFFCVAISFNLLAQVGISTTNATPHNSAMLDITSTSKGLLIPRVTTAQREAIASPAKGLMVIDTTLNSLWYFNGTAWGELSSVTSNLWNRNGNHIFNTNTGNVGIGTNTPNSTALLDVNAGASQTNGFLVSGTFNSASTVPDLGAGTRMMFYPGRSAFRAGTVSGSQWDNSNVGFYSIALGNSTTASGNYSTAFGSGTTARRLYSTALGYNTTANGSFSTAMGNNTTHGGIFHRNGQ